MNTKRVSRAFLMAALLVASILVPNQLLAQRQLLGRIGQINGNITWFRGQVPITLGNTGVPGHIIGADDAISITPFTVRIVPSTKDGVFGTTIEKAITGFKVKFNRVSLSGRKVVVSYSVSKLPLGVSIQLRVVPKQVAGTFTRSSNVLDTVLELSRPTTNGFDFNYNPPPK